MQTRPSLSSPTLQLPFRLPASARPPPLVTPRPQLPVPLRSDESSPHTTPSTRASLFRRFACALRRHAIAGSGVRAGHRDYTRPSIRSNTRLATIPGEQRSTYAERGRPASQWAPQCPMPKRRSRLTIPIPPTHARELAYGARAGAPRVRLPSPPHSFRNATIGSTRLARRAGM